MYYNQCAKVVKVSYTYKIIKSSDLNVITINTFNNQRMPIFLHFDNKTLQKEEICNEKLYFLEIHVVYIKIFTYLCSVIFS